MGNLVSVTLSVGIDFIVGSLTAMVWEKIFNPYDATQQTYISAAEGILQMGASVSTAQLLSGMLTPSGGVVAEVMGFVGIMNFIFLFSPNMVAKLCATHATSVAVLGF